VWAFLLVCATLAPHAARPAERPDALAERYEVDLAFQPEDGFLHARVAVTLRPLQNLAAIEFELNPRLRILEITDGQGRQLSFDRSQRMGSPRVLVRLAEPVIAGGAEQELTLTFTYEGTPLAGRSGLDYITKDGIVLRDESRWYPAVDLAAFTQNDIRITVPKSWYAVTSGEPAAQQTTATSAVYGWKTSQAVSSRALVAVPRPPAICSSLEGASSPHLSIWTCFGAQEEKSKPHLADQANRLLSRYSELFGPYAQPRLTIVEGFPHSQGAMGYSAPGFLVVSPDVVRFFGNPGYAPEFLPHEIAHQWFPIEVTLAGESDGWLAESLVEYIAWRDLVESDSEQARLMVARAMRDSLAFEPLRPVRLGLKLFALEDWEVTQATLYQRGMLILRTLETVIGRERVGQVLREFYRRKAGSSASIADFRKICEEISGRDLSWFFEYFLDGAHVPEIELRRVPSAAPGEVAGEIAVRNVPPEFTVRVDMRIHTTGGPIDHSVATRGEVTPFAVTTPNAVTGIALDPDLRILRWTEAARRNRSQRPRLAEMGELERAGQLAHALRACQQALELDPEDIALNHQQIYFQMGRLRFRMGQLARARQNFGRVLALPSLEPMTSDFRRAWARVYRARIERRQGHPTTARAEAKLGLEMTSPALETTVTWPEAPGHPISARDALSALPH